MAAKNFQVLRPIRKKLRPGDVFAMRLPDGWYLFGRVIPTEARWTHAPAEESGTVNLVYVFRHLSSEKVVAERRELRRTGCWFRLN